MDIDTESEPFPEAPKVDVFVEASLLEHEWIFLRPCRNTHGTRLRTSDLARALVAWDHPPTVLHF